jgi:hypothetical protein
MIEIQQEVEILLKYLNITENSQQTDLKEKKEEECNQSMDQCREFGSLVASHQ